jgi:hypothetical protein
MCKTDRNMGWLKELVLKNRRLTIHEIADMVKIGLVQFRAFWKTVWKCCRAICITFRLSFYWLRNRRRILFTSVRTFKKTRKDTNNCHVTFLFSQNLKWHSKDDKLLSPRFKQNCRRCLPSITYALY